MPRSTKVNSTDIILKDELTGILTATYRSIKKKYDLTDKEVIDLISKIQIDDLSIPVSVFNIAPLGILEAAVKYLKDELHLRFNKISAILNRNNKTIWTAYRSSTKKHPKRLSYDKEAMPIPASIFKNRTLAPLESVTSYLKENRNLSFKEISVLLNRDNRNIWAVHKKAQKKRSQIEH
ncbi:MAG: hypothetical protein ABIC04_01420 [Nanoarchaeota archaeon]